MTIHPQWAYKKGGLQDENGTYLVPPYTTLIFDLQLVSVGPIEYVKRGARSPRGGPLSPPTSPGLTPTSPRSPAMWPTGGGLKSPKSPASRSSSSPKIFPTMTPLPEAMAGLS